LGIPLSEAIAMQYRARRPWWRKVAEALGERVPETLRGHWALDVRAVVALAMLALGGAALGGWYLWRSQPEAMDLPASAAVAAAPSPGESPTDQASTSYLTSSTSLASAATSAPAATLIVDVEGHVVHPGIQTLPAGSRVYAALQAAGGIAPGTDTTGLDLARPLLDGEQLRVGLPGAPTPPAGVAEPTGGHGKHAKGVGQPVNLNTATVDQLETVPGIGPAMAQRVLDWRAQHGRFTTIGQLRQVKGIGEHKFAELQGSVTV
jgi:competence protein ComEA